MGLGVAAVFVLVLVGFLVLIFGSTDVVKRQYATKAAASQDGLFERGWLPAFIPETSVNISVTTNLDIGTAEGSFAFDKSEADQFMKELRKRNVGARKLGRPKEYEALKERGSTRIDCSTDDKIWLFMVNSEAGSCEYWAGTVW